MSFQKGHPVYKGAEKGWFKKGERSNPNGEFKKGVHNNPSGEIKKGQRLSPKTEFGNIPAWNKGIKTGLIPGNFKGDEVRYGGLHSWVKRHKGKPIICEFCRKDKRRFTWANLSGKYERRLDDFISLCYSCHKKFDLERTSKYHQFFVNKKRRDQCQSD